MRKTLHVVLYLVMTISIQTAYSQLYSYTNDPYGGAAYVNPNVTAIRLLRGGGASGAEAGCPIGFNTKGFSTAPGFDTTLPSVVLQLIPDPFVTVHISTIQADFRISEQGPVYARFSYSIDSALTWIDPGYDITPIINDCGGGTITGSWDMPDFSSDQLIYIRISGYGALDTTGRLNITNILIGGEVELIDEDGDGYGIYIDCDDTNPDIHPGATEICNDIDEDCDGIASEVSASITPTGIISLCRHEFITLHAPAGYGEYQWYKNGYIIPGETDSTIYTEKPGYYQVLVTDGACSDTSEVQAVAVYDNPFANIYWPEGTDLCFDDSIKLKVSYGDTYTWQWYKDGDPMLFENFYKILATETGDYYCMITTYYGCMRITDTVTIINSCKAGEIEEKNLSVFPNPAKNNVTITAQVESDFSGTVIATLVNINGQTVTSQELNLTNGYLNGQLNIFTIPAGIYFIKVNINDQLYTTPLSISK